MAALEQGAAAGTLRVWDPWVRLAHWAIALLLPISWWTAETGRFDLHFLSGYAILALVLFRLAWGVVGSDTARFARFLKGPAAAFAHLAHLRHRAVPAEIGHNPAGGWAVVLLLGLLLAQAASGLFADSQVLTRGPLARRVDEAWSDLATSVHLRVFWAIVATAVVHVLAVLAYRVVAGRDLVRPMITGAMPAPRGAAPPRMGSNLLALVLLAAASAFVWWISSLAPARLF
jgi:cytochrome b